MELLYAPKTDSGYGTTEQVRFMLKEAKMQYTETETSPSQLRKLMDNGRATGVLCGKLPLLKIGDVYHESSPNILEMIAKMSDEKNGTNFSGDAGDEATLRAIAMFANEFQDKLDAESDKKVNENTVKENLTMFTGMIERNDKNVPGDDHFIFGKHFTYADVAFAAVVNGVSSRFGGMKVRPFPKVKELHDSVVGRVAFGARFVERGE